MDQLGDLYHRFTTGDPELGAAINDTDATVLTGLRRVLRMTPLHTLARSRDLLVDGLLAAPDLHGPLRASWIREDPRLTALVFSWVDAARCRREREAGLGVGVGAAELSAA